MYWKLSNSIKSILDDISKILLEFYQIAIQHTRVANRRSHHQPIFEFNGKYLESFTSLEYSTEIELSKSTISSHCSTSGKIILKLHHVWIILSNISVSKDIIFYFNINFVSNIFYTCITNSRHIFSKCFLSLFWDEQTCEQRLWSSFWPPALKSLVFDATTSWVSI